MKKLLLSFSVIGAFILYSLHQKNESDAVRIVAPTMNSAGTSQVSNTANNNPTPSAASGSYKDGSYTGVGADAYYGTIQVKAIIQNGKISDVQFLQYPSDRSTSIDINTQAMPYLKQEAIQTQNSQVDIVSGATDSSQAFIQSLQSALDQAKA